MKRFIGLVICLLFIASTTLVYAAPVGNVSIPAVLKKGLVMQDQREDYAIVVVSENDIVYDRNLEKADGSSQFAYTGAKIGVAYLEKYMVYGIIGAGKALQQFSISNTTVKWDTEWDIVWGVGGTALIYETKVKELMNGILRVGVDGRYIATEPDVDKVVSQSDNFGLNGTPTVTSSSYEYGEWQVALIAALQIDKFIPYLGVKFSDAVGDAKATMSSGNGLGQTISTDFKVDFEGQDNVGIFLGADYLINNSVALNIEGRFIDETALSGGATIRF